VDVRYMLWYIDKLGGAKNNIDELKLGDRLSFFD
jgi:hypothetical protein